MTWITRVTLPAVGLALLLAGPAQPLHAQVSESPGDSASGGAGPGDSGQPVGGANSGGGELPKCPKPDHGTSGQPPIVHEDGPAQTGQGGAEGTTSGTGTGGDPGGSERSDIRGHRRRWVLHHNASLNGPGVVVVPHADPDAAGSPASTSPDSITTVVRLVNAQGASISGALLIASDATGHVLAVAVTDEHGVALLSTAASGSAQLILDAAGGELHGVAVPAGSVTGIVLAH